MSLETVVFYLLAGATLASAALVIAARNPINSAMSLVASFFFLAGLYAQLLAHTIAVLQVLVYAGAIMVLFLFVIMLLSLTDLGEPAQRVTFARIVGAAAAAGLLLVLVAALSRWQASGVQTAPGARGFGTLEAVGALLYARWILPFEAVSLLLLVAMVGAVVVAKPRI
ncbi:MAG TPA: NADH-quinone oxidoreductase subunit J [Myxococcaceae bacterium]|nr:NADH-quinone oxidoreductase subunit J [Myxococcaceae bacterium]